MEQRHLFENTTTGGAGEGRAADRSSGDQKRAGKAETQILASRFSGRACWKLKTPGQEREDLLNISGRTFHQPPESGTYDSGYWWLAYSWDNYLMACGLGRPPAARSDSGPR